MPKRFGKGRHEGKTGPFDPFKRPPRDLPGKAERSNEGFRGRRDKSSQHFVPSGRPKELPEKTDHGHGDSWGHGRREEKPFPSFDRAKREHGFVPGDRRPSAPEQGKTVSAAALKRGFARAKDDIVGMCDEISALMTSRYNIASVELTVSFNTNGEFIGFGAGGAASIKITIIPSK
ncbi:MAG: hypothetical protein A4E65_02877 [Syntrophorhabdus sp. PtaU1.Bin153]|nr:MAG: hypothetical protein A4E65_02877 [Syntrophorhabdus sp. PtaU1.Bin153]